jgi:hypothetical protein
LKNDPSGLSTDPKARLGEALAAHLRGEIKAASIKGE